MQVTITDVNKVPAMVLFKGATHVLSLLHSREFNDLRMPGTFSKDNWLRLDMDDVIHENVEAAPKKEQVQEILEWVKTVPDDAHLVVHCFAGVSRSTAAALAIKVQELGVDKIQEAINWLVDTRPQACPNPVITKHADEILGANGELHAAAEEVANKKLLSLYGGSLAFRSHLKE